jgi:putative phosphoesterase
LAIIAAITTPVLPPFIPSCLDLPTPPFLYRFPCSVSCMLAAVSDTHGRESPRLEGRTREAVGAADVVVHAGDFTTPAVLDGFEAACELRGVTGNNDPPALEERLPAERTVEWAGLRVAVVHGHEHAEVGLSMLGRERGVDLVVFGHSHAPGFEDGAVPLLNPGSHADPRGCPG